MEREKKRKSTDSGGSLASSVPEDLQIATPDDNSPQIKRRDSTLARRTTVMELAERIQAFVKQTEKAHGDFKAAHEEVRLIAKAAETTNEAIFQKMETIEKNLQGLDTQFADVKREMSLLKTQFHFKAAARCAPTPGSATKPVSAKMSGGAAQPVVKGLPAATSSTSKASLKKASPEIPVCDINDEFCVKCNSDYPEGTEHVCKF